MKPLTAQKRAELHGRLLAAIGRASEAAAYIDRSDDDPYAHQRALYQLNQAVNNLVEIRATLAALKP